MPSRRALLARSTQLALLLGGAGLLPGRAQAQAAGYDTASFDAKSMADLVKALGVAAPAESADVTLTAPEVAENGAVVPVAIATTLPGVRRIAIVVEKNPAVLSALFEVSEAIEPSFGTRLKMAESSNVYAVAFLADGRVLFARKDVRVTLGGCG